jgi:hypothetical protein
LHSAGGTACGIDDATAGLRISSAIRYDDADEIEVTPSLQRQMRRRAFGPARIPFGPIFEFPHRAFGGFFR